jgi:SpoIID/LytB domain protein
MAGEETNDGVGSHHRAAARLAVWLVATITVLVAIAPALASAEPATKPRPAGTLIISGKGWGHGVGLAQDGALAMGQEGRSTYEILSHFYPGTAIGTIGGEVRVSLVEGGRDLSVRLPGGGEIRSPQSGPQQPGFPVAIGGNTTFRVTWDGTSYTVSGGGLSPSLRSNQPIWGIATDGGGIAVPATGRAYRGHALLTAQNGPFRLINAVNLEDYLRGMGEVRDPSWPQASLQSQAIAARTYAMWKMKRKGELCATQRCQVYLGRAVEYRAMDQAIAATAGQVLVHNGSLVEALYSANAGGHAATTIEGFGPDANELPYIEPVAYPSPDPMPWQLEIDAGELGRRFGYRGTVTGVVVSSVGPSGRAMEVTIDGNDGPLVVGGIAIQKQLGLNSTLFTITAHQQPEVLAAPEVTQDDAVAAARPARVAHLAGLETKLAAAVSAGRAAPSPDAAMGQVAWVALATLTLVGAAHSVRQTHRIIQRA